MILKIFIISLAIILFAIPAHSQINLKWEACYNGPDNDRDNAEAICVDDSGNVYVTGASRNGGWFDYLTIKYDQQGNQIWAKRYGDIGIFQVSHDLVLDDQSNVYVTGGSETIKYDTDGKLLWVVNNDAECRKIILDSNGNLLAGGTGFGDIRLLKISQSGNILWTQIYNGTANNSDRFNDMVLDSEGNIIVVGQSRGEGTYWDYVTIKYTSEGDSLWVRRYNGPCSLFPGDYARAVTVDDEDNVYVTGWSDGVNCDAQCFTIAYNSDGEFLWEHRYPGIGYSGYDVLYNKGYIYVVARSTGIEDIILKYDKSGNMIWNRSYLSNHIFVTIPPGLAKDSEGNIYLRTINWFQNELRSNFVLLKYNTTGDRLWEYNYPGNGNNTSNAAIDFVLDKNNNVYLTGQSSGWVCLGGNLDYLTIKVSQDKVSIDPQSVIVTEFELFQNYPNPFNPETTIRFALSKREFVELKLYDMLGREVRTLLSEDRVAGTHSITFNAEGLASGVYYYGITAGEFSESRKLILLK